LAATPEEYCGLPGSEGACFAIIGSLDIPKDDHDVVETPAELLVTLRGRNDHHNRKF
jgi:hypothetical protein